MNEVVAIFGVTSRTCGTITRSDLLAPESTEFSGRRLYGRADLIRLQEILTLNDLRLPLKGTARVLDADGDADRRASAGATRRSSARRRSSPT
jgi:DNA-binding transcriptional MerR regulator